MKGGHPMELASHGLRIEKRWGSMCLDQITHEYKIGAGEV
jgi:hypothetical protein